MCRKLLLWVFVVLLVCIADNTFAAQPYPNSSFFSGITWHYGTQEDAAPGSDQWPVTWADDGHLYACWGDGGGFGGTNSDGRVSMGVARIEGQPPMSGSWDGINVWGGKNPESSQSAEEGKADPVCVDGDLYLAAIKQDTWDKTRMFKSTNHGMTWTWTDYDWEYLIRNISFLQFGQDYSGVPAHLAGYVYLYFNLESPLHYGLARTPRAQIMNRSAYTFFAGLDGYGDPIWSATASNYEPVFNAPDGAGWGHQIMYHPVFERYFFTKFHNEDGGWGLFDAPEPWGPWTTVDYHENNWIDGYWKFCFSFNQKWMSLDGKTMWMIFSGWPEYDGYHHIQCTLNVSELAANITAPADDSNEWYGEPVTLQGTASGGVPPYSYSWSSDVDGVLGTGSTLAVSDLSVHRVGSSVEPHTITLTVEDSNTPADIDTDQIDLTIFFKGDFEPDGDVDFDDYAVFADDWLYSVETIEGPTPTSAWWKFDEESGSSAADSSVNTNTGTLHNMSTPWVAGKFGNALDFDGSDDYVQVADHSSISFGTGSFSIAFWIKKDSFSADGEVLINGSSGPPPAETGNRYEITNTNSYGDGDPTPSGAMVFIIDNHAAGNKKVLTSNTTFVTGDWVHCVCIRDATVPQLYIYRNAVLDDDKPGHALDIDSSGEPLYIAQDENGGQRFQGQLDDIRFYNYVLSGDDIDDLYNAGPGIADSPANFNDDEIVDFEDLAELTEDWLE